MKIITISGLDGSGKSTQSKLLKEYLEHRGAKVFYFHAISFSLPNKIIKLIKDTCHISSQPQKNDTGNQKQKEAKIKKETKPQKSVSRSSWLGILLRKIILPVDLWRFELLRNKLRSRGYDYILSDRYFYDTVVNIEYLKIQNAKCQVPSYIPNVKIPKPDTAIYLQTDPKIIMKRNKKAPDQGLKFLESKKKILDKEDKIWHWITINNSHKSKSETFEEIKKVVI